MKKRRVALFEENTTVSQTSVEDRMTGKDQNFSEKDDSEDGKSMYMKTLHKRGAAVIQIKKWKLMMTQKFSIDGIVNMMIILISCEQQESKAVNSS